MEFKEDHKRNSKTYKKAIGHHDNWSLGHIGETITINGNSSNKDLVSYFIDTFLPQHSEMRGWQEGVEYSLKKRGRWNLCSGVEAAWRRHQDQLAEMEADVAIADLRPRDRSGRNWSALRFKRMFRNHGQVEQKTRLRRGKGSKRQKLDKWDEGDPTKVQTIETKKAVFSDHIKRMDQTVGRGDLNIKIVSKDDSSFILPGKKPLKSHKSDKYTHRRTQNNLLYSSCGCVFKGVNQSKIFKNLRGDLNDWEEEDEEMFHPSINQNLPNKDQVVNLADLVVTKQRKQKRKKSKANRSNCEDNLKPKPIFEPVNEFPSMLEPPIVVDTSGREWEEYVYYMSEVSEVFQVELDSVEVPPNCGWTVSYSSTSPTICEVWKGSKAFMFMKVQEVFFAQIHGEVFEDYSFLGKITSVEAICRRLSGCSEGIMNIQTDQANKVEFYPAQAAHRYVADPEAAAREEAGVDLARLEAGPGSGPGWVTVCSICLETDCSLLAASCGHAYCSPCWARWLASPGGARGRCPQPRCAAHLDTVAHRWLAGPRRHLAASRDLVTSCLASDPHLARCRRCARVARRRDPAVRRADCACGARYCWGCGEPDHAPATCAELARYSHYARVVAASRSQEREVEVRPCPRCGQLWEKMYGCNHMTCPPPCNASFCWGCGRDQAAHPGYMCGGITVPLERMSLNPLPTEIAVMKQIELFDMVLTLSKTFHKPISDKQMKELVSKAVMVEDRFWIQKVFEEYYKSYQLIKYGLLCDLTLRSKKKITHLKNGLSSLTHLRELLQTPKYQSAHWRNLVKLYVTNIILASRHVAMLFKCK